MFFFIFPVLIDHCTVNAVNAENCIGFSLCVCVKQQLFKCVRCICFAIMFAFIFTFKQVWKFYVVWSFHICITFFCKYNLLTLTSKDLLWYILQFVVASPDCWSPVTPRPNHQLLPWFTSVTPPPSRPNHQLLTLTDPQIPPWPNHQLLPWYTSVTPSPDLIISYFPWLKSYHGLLSQVWL